MGRQFTCFEKVKNFLSGHWSSLCGIYNRLSLIRMSLMVWFIRQVVVGFHICYYPMDPEWRHHLPLRLCHLLLRAHREHGCRRCCCHCCCCCCDCRCCCWPEVWLLFFWLQMRVNRPHLNGNKLARLRWILLTEVGSQKLVWTNRK